MLNSQLKKEDSRRNCGADSVGPLQERLHAHIQQQGEEWHVFWATLKTFPVRLILETTCLPFELHFLAKYSPYLYAPLKFRVQFWRRMHNYHESMIPTQVTGGFEAVDLCFLVYVMCKSLVLSCWFLPRYLGSCVSAGIQVCTICCGCRCLWLALALCL